MTPINLNDLSQNGYGTNQDHPAVYFIFKSDKIPSSSIEYNDIKNHYDKLIYIGCSNNGYLSRTINMHALSFQGLPGPDTPQRFQDWATGNGHRLDNLWIVGFTDNNVGLAKVTHLEDFAANNNGELPGCNSRPIRNDCPQ